MDKIQKFLDVLAREYTNNGYEGRYTQLLKSAFDRGWNSYSMTAQYEPLLIAIEDMRYNPDGSQRLGIPNGWPKGRLELQQFLDENWAVGNQGQIWDLQIVDQVEALVASGRMHMNSWFITQWDMENREPLGHSGRLVGLDTIPQGERYVFPISINGSAHFVLASVLERGVSIPQRVVDDCRAGLARILFHEVYEGHGFNDTHVKTFLESHSRAYNIPMNTMAFMDANFLTPALQAEYGSVGFYYPYWENHVGSGHEWHHNNRVKVDSHIKRLRAGEARHPYNVIHLNRRPRWHRSVSTAACFYRMSDAGVLWTYTEPPNDWTAVGPYAGNNLRGDPDWDAERFVNASRGEGGYPPIIDDDYLSIIPKIYDVDCSVNDTFLNCDVQYQGAVNWTNETMFVEPNTVFFSEKTFKPILAAQPFILAGNAGMMRHLHDLGYKTFHPYIDESYDMETNPAKRMSMILREAERIARLSPSEMRMFLKRVAPTVIHNYELIQRRMLECTPKTKIINDIYQWVHS
jgi:hypothetical protein